MFGTYVHIPFCLQRCRYCDFATYATDQKPVNSEYVDGLISEIHKQKGLFGPQYLDTIYFGGGTPSLLQPYEIVRILNAYSDAGFTWDNQTEVTIEMNPATLNEKNMEALLAAGVNRISVGAQTFHDHHLKNCGRRHSAQQTMDTVALLQMFNVNYSLDLLFALPEQTISELQSDLDRFLEIAPPHISPYCLTLAAKHPMNINRPQDDVQTQMFEVIWTALSQAGYERYEISNFAKPGLESRHNRLYWTDQNYWGVGLSAHSYKKSPEWGTRFWNPSDYDTYLATVGKRPHTSSQISDYFAASQREDLNPSQSLTDFCHTFLRTQEGLDLNSVRHKFGDALAQTVKPRLASLAKEGLLETRDHQWRLTNSGVLLSNLVFERLLFLAEDIDNIL